MLGSELRVEDAALFVDVDEVRAPAEPAGLRLKATVRKPTLRRILRHAKGRIVVMSGRAMADVDRLVGGAVTCICGSYGLQRRTSAADVVAFAPHPRLRDAALAAQAFSRNHNGLQVSVKPLGVAFYLGACLEFKPLVRQFCATWAASCGLELIEGEAVMELRTPGASKGDAVHAYLNEDAFCGAVPIFIGHDLSDEQGFAAAIARGGFGILVGEPRRSLARYRLPDSFALHAWLNHGVREGAFDLRALGTA
jgi:trehalose 6-phosphate phosphatase